jgi:hypothetical protein
VTLQDIDWQRRAGRDKDGDRYSIDILIHGSGRILAKIFGPTGPDEFQFRANFYCKVKGQLVDNENDCFDFIDLDSAKAFVERVVIAADPLALESGVCSPNSDGRFRSILRAD